MKRNIINFIVLVICFSSCNKDNNGPYIEIYKFKGDYVNHASVLISKNDTNKLGGVPIKNLNREKPMKFHKGYYANGSVSPRTAYLSITWEEYDSLPKIPHEDSLIKWIIDRHPFEEYWEDENEVLRTQYNGFDTARLNQIIDAGEMAKYFKRIL
jgi:hypothetical protein